MDTKDLTQVMTNKVVIGIVKGVHHCAKIEKIWQDIEESFALIRRMLIQLDKEPDSNFKYTSLFELQDQLDMHQDFCIALNGIVKSIEDNIEQKNMFLSLISNI